MIGLLLIILLFVLLIGIFRRVGRAGGKKPRIKYTTRWERAADKRRRDAQIKTAARNAIELAKAQERNNRLTREG